MRTDAAGNPTFKYGPGTDNGDGTVSAGTELGDADADSNFRNDGTITVLLSNSKLGGSTPVAGQKLDAIFMRVVVGAVVPDNANYPNPDPAVSYMLSGNASCAPNRTPIAVLSATPTSGTAPLAVHFDASSSSDSDGDAIASYQFNFGDGSPAVTQSSPKIDHTYTAEGEYRATVRVTDARGATSVNIADATIDAAAPTTSQPGSGGALPNTTGYWLVAKDGGIFNYGDAKFFGSTGNLHLEHPMVAMAARPQHDGYWLVSTAGEIFAFGAAESSGSLGGRTLTSPIVGIAATPSGKGYYLVAADGGVFNFGDAKFHGSMGGKALNSPIVSIAATSGDGYLLVAADGGAFNFGDAKFRGSMGGKHLNAPIVGVVFQPGSGGYWMVATDGGVFAFGAPFYGSQGGKPLNKAINAISTVTAGDGYRFGAFDGGVFDFGPGAPFRGSHGGTPLNQPVNGMAGF
jgi:PKD repeat protein